MRTRFLISGVALIAAIGAACSANSGDTSRVPGAGGSGQGGTGNAGGTVNPGGSSFGGASGSGGVVNIDGGGGSSGGDLDAPCQAVSQTAKTALTPADIVWAVDTSCSMIEEAAAVQQNINAFSAQIIQSGIDAHVVMLASYPIFFLPGVCVGAPLGTGQCPQDSKPPNFFHHPSAVIGSVDAAALLIQYFPDYRNMLRPNALKHIVVVTDDDSRTTGGSGSAGPYDNNPDKFIQDYTALDPMLANATGGPNWKLSAIFAFTEGSACPIAAAEGLVWRQIVQKTGGVPGDMCACVNAAACAAAFQTIFNELATKIVEGAKPIDCEWSIPAPPPGEQFNKEKVNVELIDQINGTKETIYHVEDQSKCDPTLGGWYYDNNTTPTKVISCPTSCDTIKGTSQGRLDVLFGCATEPIPR